MIPALVLLVPVLAYFAYKKMPSSVKCQISEFNRRFRVWEDLQLVPGIGYATIYHIWQSLKSHRFSLWYDIESNCLNAKYANKVAINYVRPIPGKNVKVDGDAAFKVDSYTYREMYDIVLRLSYILEHEHDIHKGDIVTMYFMNKALFIFIWLALWNIGAIPALLNYNLKHKPLVHSVNVVKPKTLLVDATDCLKDFKETEEEIRLALPELKISFLAEEELMPRITDPTAPTFRQSDEIRDQGVQAWHPALFVYTSGTTGMPKSAVNSWRKVFFASFFFPVPMRINADTNLYTAMPLYHGTASILGVCPVLVQGGRLSLGLKFSVSSYWTQVKLTNSNSIQYVGEVCRYLVDAAPTEDEHEWYGKIKLAVGNGLRRDIWRRFKERFGIKAIGEFYASSESPFATTCYEVNGSGEGAIRNNGWLANVLLSNAMYTLVRMEPEDDNTIYRNAKGFCEEPGPEQKGELITRIWNPRNVKTTFPGYTNNDKETYSKVIRDVFHKGDAWVRSDDLMKYDDVGNIYFVDRMGDTYRWKSENVSTTEVENEILEVPEIEYCVVVGCRVENHEGRCGYAVIQTKNNNTESAEDKLKILDKVADRAYGNLPHFARPCFVRFDSVEVSANHKISKKQFRDPVLPAGPSGTQEVYYLDTKARDYKPLTAAIYQDIAREKVRI